MIHSGYYFIVWLKKFLKTKCQIMSLQTKITPYCKLPIKVVLLGVIPTLRNYHNKQFTL